MNQPEVLESGEAFEEIDGEYKYAGTLVVYRDDNGSIYHARSPTRFSSPSEIKTETLTDKTLIPPTAYMPLFQSRFTRASPDLLRSSGCHVKRPRLTSYDQICGSETPNKIAEQVLQEVEVCEILKQHPHPNVAEYLGCEVGNGRISGICFARYEKTLMQRVNPKGYMKRAAAAAMLENGSCRAELGDIDTLIQKVGKGSLHLHSLGIVHNDINPSNIMFGNGDLPVVIDFGSCRRVGEDLEEVGRTYEWYDESVQVSGPGNDLDALEEIRRWLVGDGMGFQFGE